MTLPFPAPPDRTRADRMKDDNDAEAAWDAGSDPTTGAAPASNPPADTPPPIPALDTPPVPPSAVGRYRVLRRLGRGGMGDVFAAFDPQLQREVAGKVLRPHLADDPGARIRFVREARAAAAVQHDNVLPVHEVGEADGVPFLVMPLLAGETLAARLRRDGPLPPADVARLGRDAAAGLAAAHARGLVHRDVKPSNLWIETVSGGWRVRVLDFGLARAAADDRLTGTGLSPGTPGYMSPEQAEGSPALDPRTDLFSLGAVLYEAATGRPAFPADP